MVSEQRLEQALTRLAQSDEPHADAKMEMLRSEYAAEAVRDSVYLVSDGTIEDRKAIARQSGEYKEAMLRYFDAVRKFTALNNKRQHEVMIVDVFRTLEASRRVGNV